MSDSIFEVEYHPGEEVVLRFKPPRFRRLPDSTRQHLSPYQAYCAGLAALPFVLPIDAAW